VCSDYTANGSVSLPDSPLTYGVTYATAKGLVVAPRFEGRHTANRHSQISRASIERERTHRRKAGYVVPELEPNA
jgi:hypothetical protein